MSTKHLHGGASSIASPDTDQDTSPGTSVENEVAMEAPTVEGWTPEDREPSAAENNFMSFALFAFLILFGLGCLIVF